MTMNDNNRDPEEQLRIDLLNAYYTAFKAGVDTESATDLSEEAREMALEDAN